MTITTYRDELPYPKLNTQLIRDILAQITLDPDSWEQSSWISFNCRTKGCVAGLAVMHPPLEANQITPLTPREPYRAYLGEGASDWISYHPNDMPHIVSGALNVKTDAWSWRRIGQFQNGKPSAELLRNLPPGHPVDEIPIVEPYRTSYSQYVYGLVDDYAPEFLAFKSQVFQRYKGNFVEVRGIARIILGIPLSISQVLFDGNNTFPKVAFILASLLDQKNPDLLIRQAKALH